MPDWAARTARLQAIASLQLFFVGGAPRSGTTWLQQMLDAHPEVACRGEGLFLNHFAVPLEKLVQERAAVLDFKNRTLFAHTGGFPLPDVSMREHVAATTMLLAFEQYGLGPGCRAVGEKTPENVFYFPRRLAMFPAARFIAIARDPRDMLSSAWHFFAKPKGQDIGAFVRAALPSLESGARAMVAFADANPERTCLVSYESLLQSPNLVLTRLFTLLGVATDPGVIRRVVAGTGFVRATGGRAPGDVRDGSFLRSGTTGEGRRTFRPTELALIMDQMAWMFPLFDWAV